MTPMKVLICRVLFTISFSFLCCIHTVHYCSISVPENAPLVPIIDDPQTTLVADVPDDEPQTTLKPVVMLLPHTTELPQTTELPETLVPQTTDEPQTTEEPQTTDEGATVVLPFDSVTVPVEEL